jgi:hypothetical protein
LRQRRDLGARKGWGVEKEIGEIDIFIRSRFVSGE